MQNYFPKEIEKKLQDLLDGLLSDQTLQEMFDELEQLKKNENKETTNE